MEKYKVITLVFTISLNFQATTEYKILGIFPYDGQSHFIVFQSLMKGLALKGHTVHVLSHYPLPQNTSVANYTDLSVAGSMPLRNNKRSFRIFDNDFKLAKALNFKSVSHFYHWVFDHENVMKTGAVQKLLKSNEKYDLIVTESFVTDMFLGFVHKFKVPFVFLTSISAPPWLNVLMANPQNPAFIPYFVSPFPPKMSFFERVGNTFGLVVNLATWYGFMAPASQRMMNKYFGNDIPTLIDIARNASLVLVNTPPIISGGRPFAPNFIDVGGIHIQPAKKLPRDIENFIEESSNGVIYFCMGSILRGATLPKEKKDAFLYAFSKLKERVLWKFEEEDASIPDNILIKKWMPQRDILAHPKVKLFISHGGLLGLLEAVSEGKPIVGIPMCADQGTNIRTLEQQGIAKFVDYSSIDNETIHEAIQEILKLKYAENAKELSRIFHDRHMSPMDTAIYWIEYVIRNKGAKILRSPAADLSYFQYLLIDVFLFSLFSLIACTLAMYYLFKLLLCRYCRLKSDRTKLKGE